MNSNREYEGKWLTMQWTIMGHCPMNNENNVTMRMTSNTSSIESHPESWYLEKDKRQPKTI